MIWIATGRTPHLEFSWKIYFLDIYLTLLMTTQWSHQQTFSLMSLDGKFCQWCVFYCAAAQLSSVGYNPFEKSFDLNFTNGPTYIVSHSVLVKLGFSVFIGQFESDLVRKLSNIDQVQWWWNKTDQVAEFWLVDGFLYNFHLLARLKFPGGAYKV